MAQLITRRFQLLNHCWGEWAAAKRKVGRQWHVDMAIYERLHVACIRTLIIVERGREQVAYDEGTGKVVLRVQCAQLLEDSLKLPIDVTDDDAACVSMTCDAARERQTYIFAAIVGDGAGDAMAGCRRVWC